MAWPTLVTRSPPFLPPLTCGRVAGVRVRTYWSTRLLSGSGSSRDVSNTRRGGALTSASISTWGGAHGE